MVRTQRTRLTPLLATAAVIALFASGTASLADEHDNLWELSLRGGIGLGDGDPYNDSEFAGLVLRRTLTERYRIGASLEYSKGDYENPAFDLGISTPVVTDSLLRSVELHAFGESVWPISDSGFQFTASAGLGIGFVSADDITGATSGGGTFDITTDNATEFIPGVGVEIQYHFTESISAALGSTLRYHFTDMKSTDRVSGATYSVDDYFINRAYLGMSYHF